MRSRELVVDLINKLPDASLADIAGEIEWLAGIRKVRQGEGLRAKMRENLLSHGLQGNSHDNK